MKILLHLCLFAFILCTSGCVRKYYVVRHADRLLDGTDGLTDLGMVRAKVLADSLAPKSISHIFVTNTNRTRLTAKPLSDRTGISITEYAEPLAAFVENVKTKNNSLIVGHSNTILDIVRGLGAETLVTTIGEREFDRLFIVTRKKRLFQETRVSLSERRYGASAH